MLSQDKYNIQSEILKGLKEKNRKVVEQFVSENHKKLLGRLLKNGLAMENAQDVVAETWTVFFQKLDEFRGESELGSYLFGILHNKYREYLRRNGKFNLYSNPSDLLDGNFNNKGMWTYEPMSPDIFVEALEMENSFSDCLEVLTEKQKKIFVLKVVESQDYSSLSQSLEMSIANLKVTVHRIRNQVRRCVEGQVV